MPTFEKTKPITGTTTFGSLYLALRDNFNSLNQHHASATAPADPDIGMIWFDTNSSTLKYFDGSAWLPLGSAISDVAEIIAARGSKDSLAEYLHTSHNPDGSLKTPITAANMWYESSFTATSSTTTSITLDTLDGDQTDIFSVGRRVQIHQTGGAVQLTVVSASFTTETTINFDLPLVVATATDIVSVDISNVKPGPAGNAPTYDLAGYMESANDLSDVADATTARTNLGLGDAALLNVGTAVGTVAAGDHSHNIVFPIRTTILGVATIMDAVATILHGSPTTLSKCIVAVRTAPSGGACTVRLKKNGTSDICTLSIADGTTTQTITSLTNNTLTETDWVQIDVTAANGAVDLMVTVL